MEKIMNKRGQFLTFSVFHFIIVAFLVVVLFGGLIWIMGQINDVMHQAGIANEVNAGKPGYVNMTLASDETFGVVNNSIQSLRMVAIVYILGLAICIILTSALIKIHPIFYFAYLLIVFLAVAFSAPISNAYLTLLQSNIYDGTLITFTAANYILLNLPFFTLAIGILGGIFLFIQMLRNESEPVLR